jgi:hypothetical protein
MLLGLSEKTAPPPRTYPVALVVLYCYNIDGVLLHALHAHPLCCIHACSGTPFMTAAALGREG